MQARGTAIVIGGALKANDDTVWRRIVQEAGGAGCQVAVFATAAANPEHSAAQIVAALNRCGACAAAIPVAPHLEQGDLQVHLHDPALIAQVAASRAVFFSGGAQELIVDTLQPGGQPTAMLDAIHQVFDNGGVVAGTSAGAAVMSRMMFRDAMDNMQVLKGQWRAGHEYDRGFGFVGPELFIDQHFLKRGRIGRLLPAMHALGFRLGLGVDENTGVVIKGSAIEVIGGHGAVLVDLSEATSDARLPAFNLRGALLSYLDRGDRHDLSTGVTTPAAHKLGSPPIDPGTRGYRQGQQSPHYFLDILGDGCIVSAMTQLLDSPAAEVRGLAYRAQPAPGDAAPDIGFEFRLHKGPGMMGWFSTALDTDDYTVLKVRLDVIPVRMASPLYVPLEPLEAAS